MALADNRKRARSDVDKAHRKAEILDAARAMIVESGFEGLTMSGLARRAGLAKGTLYLYARTKEELLLVLFVAAIDEVVSRIETEAARATLAEDIARIAMETPLFLPLLARLVAVIETNVADTPLFAAKREMIALQSRFADAIARLFGVAPQEALAVSDALMLAMQGAAQFDLTAQRDPATLPDDLAPVFAAHAFAQRFVSAARLILSTIG
jgi:AcrR family transcriptional regulator